MANVWELIENDTDAPFSKVNFCMSTLSTLIAVEAMGYLKIRPDVITQSTATLIGKKCYNFRKTEMIGNNP